MNLKNIPTNDLLAELESRMRTALDGMRALLHLKGLAPSEPAPAVSGLMPSVKGHGSPAPAPEARYGEPVSLAAPRESTTINVTPSEAVNQTRQSARFRRAKAAGFKVKEPRTSDQLPENHFEKAVIPTNFKLSPEALAAQVAAEDRDLEAVDIEALANEVGGEAGEYLRELRGHQQTRKMAGSMSLAQVLAKNRSQAVSAEVVKVEKARPELAVNPDPTTDIDWFDDPAVLRLDVVAVAVEANVDLLEFTGAMVKVCEAACNPMFIGHLPSPIAAMHKAELTLLGEPCAMWHFLTALEKVDEKFTKAADFAAFKLAEMVIENTPGLKIDFDLGLVAVSDFASARRLHATVSRILQSAIESSNPRKKALKRQLRLMNPRFREFQIPDATTADKMRLSDPRHLIPQLLQDEGITPEQV